jgi:hypothetical protein
MRLGNVSCRVFFVIFFSVERSGRVFKSSVYTPFLKYMPTFVCKRRSYILTGYSPCRLQISTYLVSSPSAQIRQSSLNEITTN